MRMLGYRRDSLEQVIFLDRTSTEIEWRLKEFLTDGQVIGNLGDFKFTSLLF